jgi:hypothetical protein
MRYRGIQINAMPEQALGEQELQISRISRNSPHETLRVVSPIHRPYLPQVYILVPISVSG